MLLCYVQNTCACGKFSFVIVEDVILHALKIERELYKSYMDLHEIACQPYSSDEVVTIQSSHLFTLHLRDVIYMESHSRDARTLMYVH